MDALPLMLQVALLLPGCALSRYLWEINTTIASVVLGITAFGLLFYVLIDIAGVVSENCPYQTPVANFLRYTPVAISHTPILLHRGAQGVLLLIRFIFRRNPRIFHCIRDALRRVPSIFHHHPPIFRRRPLIFRVLRVYFSVLLRLETSSTLRLLERISHEFRYPSFVFPSNVFIILFVILVLPILPILDLCKAIIWVFINFTNWVRQDQLEQHTEQTAGQQIVGHVLDLRCVLWTLQTSVDGPVRQSALEYLATITMDDSNPTQVVASWFGILLNCVQVTNGSVTIIQGYESLAERFSLYFLHILSHVVVADPLPKVLDDVRQRFTGTFPSKTNFGDLPVSRTLSIIHNVFCSDRRNTFLARSLASRAVRWRIQWNNYRPSGSEHTIVTPALVKFAQSGYKGSGEREKVPRWLLRFALHSLSQDPLPPPSVVSDALSIIAIDLECGGLGTVTVEPLDRR